MAEILPITSNAISADLQQQIKFKMQARKGWSQVEDDRLMKIIKKYGMKNWTLVSQKLSLGSINERTGKQCRERWHNHLNPGINNKEWSKKEDEILFDSHRRYGSKWKQISKLFEGRTDNSIKNHFYSTVRRCLRKISRLSGENHPTITMKSIKPNVLSKIVQNTELTNLVLKIERSKSRGSNNDGQELDEVTVSHLSSELKRITAQYQQKQQKSEELSKKKQSPHSSKSIQSFSSDSRALDTPVNDVKKLQPEDEALKSYFEEESCKQEGEREDLILETQQESKERSEPHFEINFRCFEETSQKQKYEDSTAAKQQKEEKEERQDFWIEEEESHNFFNSPSCGKKNKFPDLRLLAKISRNSMNSQSPEEQRISSALKVSWILREQKLQIDFDPRQLFNPSFQTESKQQNDQQQ